MTKKKKTNQFWVRKPVPLDMPIRIYEENGKTIKVYQPAHAEGSEPWLANPNRRLGGDTVEIDK